MAACGARAAGRTNEAGRRAHGIDENDPEGKAQLFGFTQGLSELGWTDGRNVRMDVRWAGADLDRIR